MMSVLIGDNCRARVEQQLIDDLTNHGIRNVAGLGIDWESAVGEGGGTKYEGEYIEDASDVVVTDNGKDLCCGWTDYVVDASGNLHAYWTQIDEMKSLKGRGRLKFNGNSFGMPDHIWERFSDEDKYHFARTLQGWKSDANLLPYRIEVIPELISAGVTEYRRFDTESLKQLKTAVDIDFLAAEMERLIEFSERILRKIEETHPSELIMKIYDEDVKIAELERSEDERGGEIRKYFKSIEGFCYTTRHAEVVFRIAKEKGLFEKE